MFVRIKTTPNSPRKSVQIVTSYRVGDKVRQKIIKHIGVAQDEKELLELKLLGESIKLKLVQDGQTPLFEPEAVSPASFAIKEEKNKNDHSLRSSDKAYRDEDYQVDMRELCEEGRVVSGIHDIYGKMYDELGINKIIKNPARHKSAVRILREIVLARIANPDSKRASVRMLEQDFGVNLNLEHVYRMMDKLDDDAIDRLNNLAYDRTFDLLGGSVEVIFFDATTIYFESFCEDDLRKNGFSKDGKHNQPQVLLALMVTGEGLPIGYQVFSGDTYEGHTLIPALKELKSKYNLKQVVYVADSGLFNKDNLAELDTLDAQGIEYIVGARIKNMGHELKARITELSNYQHINDDLKIARFTYKDRKLIVSYSAKRARKDAHERAKGIEKLKQKLAKHQSVKEHLSNFGYKKYIKLPAGGNSQLTIDEEKIAEDAKWDGLKGYVVRGNSSLCDNDILTHYSNLWQVEESFRISKHDLKIRPVYHFKPGRVKAHLAISFCAYILVRHMEHRIRLQYKKLSPKVIRRTLISVQTSILYCEKKKIRYTMPSTMNNEAKKIYKLMDVSRDTKPYIINKLKM